MSTVPPPGYPMTEFGKIIYAAVRQQAAPTIRYSMGWWLNWFNDGKADRRVTDWLTAEKRKNPNSIAVATMEVLMQFGPSLVARNQNNPAEQEPTEVYNVTPLVTTLQGWSVWRGGQHDIPLSDEVWRKVVVRYLQWVCREISKGNLGTRALDIAIQYMVLPAPAQRRYPNLSAPAALHDLAAQGWALWKVQTGGNEPMAMYNRASMQQWQALNDHFQRLDVALGGAERVLRYASLQEPVLRLQEKLDEFGAKREVVTSALQSFADNEQIARKVLTPEEYAAASRMQQEFYEAQKQLYDTLPKAMWDGDAPSNLSGWVLIAGVSAVLAIGLLAAVAAAVGALDNIVARQRAMNLQGRIEQELKVLAAQAETNRQECRFSAGSIADPTRRAQMIAQCDQDAQYTLAEIAKQQSRVASSAASLSTLKPQDGAQESSALYIGLGIAAWFGLRWVRKRV